MKKVETALEDIVCKVQALGSTELLRVEAVPGYSGIETNNVETLTYVDYTIVVRVYIKNPTYKISLVTESTNA